jgi:hypothetical protein
VSPIQVICGPLSIFIHLTIPFCIGLDAPQPQVGDWKMQRLQVNGNGQLIPFTPDLRMKEQQPIHEVCCDAKPGVGVTVAHEDLGVLCEAKPEFSV